MGRDKTIKILRTTKANLDTQKAANNLIAGEPYFITDEERLAMGISNNAYSEMAKKSELPSSGGATILIAYKNTNQTKYGTTIYGNDNHLFMDIEANGIYQYELLLMIYQQGSNSNGFKAKFSAPDGCTAYTNVFRNTTSNTQVSFANQVATLIITEDTTVATQGAIYNFVKANGIIINGANAGTLILQWTQYQNNNATTQVLLGSYLKLTKVN
jgi:hypothetical protein